MFFASYYLKYVIKNYLTSVSYMTLQNLPHGKCLHLNPVAESVMAQWNKLCKDAVVFLRQELARGEPCRKKNIQG